MGTSLNYDGLLQLDGAVGAAGDTMGFTWTLDGDLTSRTGPDGTTVTINTDYATRKIVERGAGNRWKRVTTDGLGRKLKEETGYGKNGTSVPEVVETIVDTEYVPCAARRLAR